MLFYCGTCLDFFKFYSFTNYEVVDLISGDSQMVVLIVVVLAHTQFEIPMKAHLDVYFGIKKVTKTKTVDEVEYVALEEIAHNFVITFPFD